MVNLTVKMSVTRILFLFLLSALQNNCFSTKKSENVTTFECLDETECNDSINIDIGIKNTVKDIDSVASKSTSSMSQNTLNSIGSVKNISLTSSLPRQFQTTSSPSTTSTLINEIIVAGIKKNFTVQKVSTDICECDLTVSSCDINCCCDSDCKEFHVSVFSHCMDHRAKLYDSRYCYDSNFIEYNNTHFILEKLASNLFCIVYDNLPPAYSTSYDLDIKNREALNDAIRHLDRSKFKWQWKTIHVEPQFNITSPYRVDDVLWKLQANFVKPIEVLQTGFTGLCSFKKTLKYLRNWKGSCMQIDLTNGNAYLFPATFNNFTVITSPHLFNEIYVSSDNQTCPRNVCLPVENHYCSDSWNFCNNTESSKGFCSEGICTNIVKSVRYVFLHNGTMGIGSLNVYVELGNVTDKFYQHFEVIYKWVDTDKEKIFVLSGNPGYNVGKPIIIGNLVINKTNNVESKYINVNRTNYFLTLPVGQKSGECHELKRYAVGFGEDIKLRCAVTLRTNNFTTRTCMEIQNRTFETLLEQSLRNITEIDRYNIYVSKLGRIDVNDTSSWVRIFLDRIPQNVITGHIIDDRIRCSGLVTSLRIDILHSLLSRPRTVDNHKILGISITFSDEVDMFWPKCTSDKSCTDLLKVDIVSYVAFHDVSKPSKYYFVGGPNLDISLPYDFFYPFLSSCKCNEPSSLVLSVLTSIGIISRFIRL